MRIDVLSVFPEYLSALDLSLIGKAQVRGLIDIRVHDLRNWATDRHRTVDDTPYGGGAGMVMKPDVWGAAIDDVLVDARGFLTPQISDANQRGPRVEPTPEEWCNCVEDGQREFDPSAPPQRFAAQIPGDPEVEEAATAAVSKSRIARAHLPGKQVRLVIPTPSGRLFTQRDAEKLVHSEQIIFACGRYEGIDSRVSQYYQRQNDVLVHEYSIGDYVLNGGEVAALVMIEAITRLIPGVIGNPESLAEESHNEDGLLEYPVFTKPPQWRSLEVPEVLLSGNHKLIADWRKAQSVTLTKQRRPDLLR